VGFYSEVIFPRLCNYFLDQPFVSEQRRNLLANAAGEVLEIGIGTGLNLPHYPQSIRKLTAVDPSIGMRRLAKRKIQQTGIEVDYRPISGERLPFEDQRFDCVVSTFTLCSVESVEACVAEVVRVLRPGGRFLYFEHGLSPDPSVQKWQQRLNWLQMRLGAGCRLNRNMRELIAGQSFATIDSNEFYLERTPKTHGYMFRGVATK